MYNYSEREGNTRGFRCYKYPTIRHLIGENRWCFLYPLQTAPTCTVAPLVGCLAPRLAAAAAAAAPADFLETSRPPKPMTTCGVWLLVARPRWCLV